MLAGLCVETFCSHGALLNRRNSLLRGWIHLCHRLTHLGKANTLFVAGCADLTLDVGDAALAANHVGDVGSIFWLRLMARMVATFAGRNDRC